MQVRKGAVVVQKVREGKGDFGYNAPYLTFTKTLHAAPVVDPAKVTRVALKIPSAGVLTTECVIVERKKMSEMPMGAPGMGGMGGMM